MNVPTVMPSARQKIHLRFCHDLGTCKYVGGVGNRRRCDYLEQLLDVNDEMLLHAKARELMDEVASYNGKRGGASMVGGLYRAAEMTDPYVKIPAFDPEMDDFNEAAEKHPDCSSCVAGKPHYHRKKDGSTVRMPDVPRETSGGDDASA